MACFVKTHKKYRQRIKELERLQSRYALALELCADDDAPKFLKDADRILDSMEHPERHKFYTLEELREKLGIEPDEDVAVVSE